MSAHSADGTLHGFDEDLATTVIVHCGLSRDAVKQIREAMTAMQLSFPEAAVHVGLADSRKVEEAVALARKSSERGGPGIIQTAIRRQSGSRALIVRPRVLTRASRQLIIAHHPDDERSERIRALRTELLLLNEPGQRTYMFALLSPSAGEGRSQLAAELAIAFSQLGQPTLLVDADLRRPRQHELFEIDNTEGLTQALVDGATPALASVEGQPNLSLLRAGPPVPNPSELLSSGHIERTIGSWRHNFHYVIVDTPPIGAYADGLIVASLVRRVLVVSRANVSTYTEMKDMMRRLVSTQARILGSVLNRF
jgi:receptor protein-tyrosine kinase